MKTMKLGHLLMLLDYAAFRLRIARQTNGNIDFWKAIYIKLQPYDNKFNRNNCMWNNYNPIITIK